ncbi:MAG: GNAT family N-acetyltransferase [Deltaproteobacteria bacterium]|nr:GNAT family N-acetyltransferase [Deltaproteobacteria bacterium]
MSVALRPLAHRDLAAWDALQRAGLPDPYSRDALERELESAMTRTFGLFEDDVLRAAVLAWLVVDELQIMTVVVDDTARRRGFGRRLVEHTLRMARAAGATFATLEVRAGNVAALALYTALGFSRDGVRPGYYPDGEDAVLMHLDFPGAAQSATEAG